MATTTLSTSCDLNKELGNSYKKLGKWKEAVQHFIVSARVHNDPESHYNIGYAKFYGMNLTDELGGCDWPSAIHHMKLGKAICEKSLLSLSKDHGKNCEKKLDEKSSTSSTLSTLAKIKSFLAHCYFNGFGVEKNQKEGIKLHKQEPRDWRSNLFLLDMMDIFPSSEPLPSLPQLSLPITASYYEKRSGMKELTTIMNFQLFSSQSSSSSSSSSPYLEAVKLGEKIKVIEKMKHEIELLVVEGDVDALLWSAIYKTFGFSSLGAWGIDHVEACQLLQQASIQGHAHAQFLFSSKFLLESCRQNYPLAKVAKAATRKT
jgi:hypothetical protein